MQHGHGPRTAAHWLRATLAAGVALGLAVAAVPPARAQSCEPNSGGCSEPVPEGPTRGASARYDDRSAEWSEAEQRDLVFLNSRANAALIARFDRIRQTCDRVNENYRLHCLTLEVRAVARSIPDAGEYAPVRAALEQASRGLQAITDRYADPAAPTVRARVGGRPAAPRTAPITAIRSADLTRATAEAEAVLDEAATVLLRSAESSARRQVAFQPIAQAIGSTKVLLRSA